VESAGGTTGGGTPGGFDTAQLLNTMMPLMVLAMMMVLVSSLMPAREKRTFGSQERRRR